MIKKIGLGPKSFLVLLLGLLASSCSQAGPSGPQVVLTPTQASKIVAQEWASNESIAINRSLDKWSQIEGGDALEVDKTNMQTQIANNVTPPVVARKLKQVEVYVPRQYQYPAQFLSVIEVDPRVIPSPAPGASPAPAVSPTPTEQPFISAELFYKVSKSDSWKVYLYATLVANEKLPLFVLDQDGFASFNNLRSASTSSRIITPTPAPSGLLNKTDLLAQISQLSTEYSNYRTAYVKTGTVGSSNFTVGPLTSSISSKDHESFISLLQSKLNLDLKYSPSLALNSGAFKLKNGGLFSLFSVDFMGTVTPQDSQGCVVSSSSGTGQQVFPPGKYASGVKKGVLMLAGSVLLPKVKGTNLISIDIPAGVQAILTTETTPCPNATP
jgi:hypothetical protein